jgi:hypothetical protein
MFLLLLSMDEAAAFRCGSIFSFLKQTLGVFKTMGARAFLVLAQVNLLL